MLRKNGVNPNVQKPNYPYSPLELAIKLGKNDIAMILLEKKANPAGAIEMALLSNNKGMLDILRRKRLFPNPDLIQNGMKKGKYQPAGMPGMGMPMPGMVTPGMPMQGMPAQGMMRPGMAPGVMGQPMMGQPAMMGQPGMMQQPMMGQPMMQQPRPF